MEGQLLFLAALAAIVVALFFYYVFVVVIPPRSFALVERFGQYNRILTSGMHFLFTPIETLKQLRGSYFDQEGRKKVMTHQIVPADNIQMDIHPISCLSKDRVKITFDATFFYTICHPQRYAYETNDTLNLFYQIIVQTVRNAVSKETSETVYQINIAPICQEVNSKTEERNGIRLNDICVQSVGVDNSILKANEDIAVKQRQAQYRMEQEQADHLREMAQMEQTKQKQLMEMDMARAQQEHSLRLEHAKAEAEAQRKSIEAKSVVARERLLMEAGFTPDQILELKHIEAMKHLAQSNNKVVYAPLPYWTRGAEKRLRQTE